MRLKSSYLVHLGLVHLAILVVAAWQYERLGAWFFAVEAVVVLSWLFGVWLARRSLRPLDFIQSFSDLLREREFSARFSPVGQSEMDRLVALYNQMLSDLYEERLRLGEQRGFLERFVEASALGVLILDYDERVTLVNPAAAELLELEPEAIRGRRLGQLASDLARDLDRLEDGESRLVTWQSVRRLRLEKTGFVDRGFRRRFVVVEELTRVIDASERGAYEKLIRLMSHEVNNTVAATNSLLQSCENYASQLEEEDRTDYTDALRVVIDRNRSLNHFMGDFAQVVKLPDPTREPCDLVALVDSLEIMFSGQCRERSIEWVRSGDRKLPRISLDREQIEQVVINIIKNGMEAIGEEGTLEVALGRHGRSVELAVLDDGCGLDRETREQLFSPFFSTKTQGQGLGLTLAKEILMRHGFGFSLDEAPDGRTRFSIRMPID